MKGIAIILLACSMQCMALNLFVLDEGGKSSDFTTVRKSRSPFYKAAFLSCLIDGSYTYLLGSTVWEGSWKWVSFASEDYLHLHGTPRTIVSVQQFELIGEDGLFRIKCQLGRESFLALKPVGKNSWQWAFFASPEYLARNPSYISHFKLIDNEDGSYSIKVAGPEPIFLAIDSSGKDYAFFATQSYLDFSEKNFCTSFFLDFNLSLWDL